MTSEDVAPALAPPQVARANSTTSVPPASDFAYPRGHLGHLSEQEEAALADFKALCEERGYFQPGPPASHDDATLLCVPVPSLPPPRVARTSRC